MGDRVGVGGPSGPEHYEAGMGIGLKGEMGAGIWDRTKRRDGTGMRERNRG